MTAVYIEEAIADHPRAREICERLPGAVKIPCKRYGEIFNRRLQNFRLQKRRPAWILAEKREHHVLPAPGGYGIGAARNYYFSHMLNCVYDCRYCFLQGMFLSANYVVFVNYEDFQGAIEGAAGEAGGEQVGFFSGYDSDSLALEPVTGFAASFLPLFERLGNAWLELRTKSAQAGALLEREPVARCVVAFSVTPEPVAARLENVPPLARRLEVMRKLAGRGWKLGLRFDPLIYHPDYRRQYAALFETAFRALPPESLHSVSLGPFRMPRGYFKRVVRLFPDEPLFAGPLEDREGMVSYPRDLEEEVIGFSTEEILRYVPREIFFPCAP